MLACVLFLEASPGAFAAEEPASSAGGPTLSSSSLSLLETAKGLIPPAAFCFTDDPDAQNPFVPLSVRASVRRWIRADEYACGKAAVQSIKTEHSSDAPARSWPAVQWIKDKVARIWSAIIDWIWEKIKGEIMHKIGG